MNRGATVVLLVCLYMTGLWVLVSLRAWDTVRVYLALPIVGPLAVLALVKCLAWVATRLDV